MLHARLIALLLAVSCAHAVGPHCETRCGVQLVGVLPSWEMPDRWSCDELQLAEDIFLEKFSDMFPAACKGMPSYLYFAQTESFMNGQSHVAGLTVCPMAQIQLSSLPPEESAYAHEMVHMLQGCVGVPPTDKDRDAMHSNWDRDGIQIRIDNWHAVMRANMMRE